MLCLCFQGGPLLVFRIKRWWMSNCVCLSISFRLPSSGVDLLGHNRKRPTNTVRDVRMFACSLKVAEFSSPLTSLDCLCWCSKIDRICSHALLCFQVGQSQRPVEVEKPIIRQPSAKNGALFASIKLKFILHNSIVRCRRRLQPATRQLCRSFVCCLLSFIVNDLR